MKIIVASPNIQTRDRRLLERHLRKAVPAIEKKFGARGARDSILRARLTSQGARYHLTLSMQLPGLPIVVAKEGDDLRALVSQCENAFKTEVQRGANKSRREYQRVEGRVIKEVLGDLNLDVPPPLPEVKSATNGTHPLPSRAASPDSGREFEAIKPLLGALYKSARRQIRTAVLAGDLPQGFLSPDDLVDQAILNVLELRVHLSESDRRLEQLLYREVETLLMREIAEQHPAEGRRMSLEESAIEFESPRARARGDEDSGDDVDPQEALHVEDVLVDSHAHSPAEAISESEEYRRLLRYLGRFHSKARSAFFLNRIEGFEPFEIAMIQNRDEASIRRDIEKCQHALAVGYGRDSNAGATLPVA